MKREVQCNSNLLMQSFFNLKSGNVRTIQKSGKYSGQEKNIHTIFKELCPRQRHENLEVVSRIRFLLSISRQQYSNEISLYHDWPNCRVKGCNLTLSRFTSLSMMYNFHCATKYQAHYQGGLHIMAVGFCVASHEKWFRKVVGHVLIFKMSPQDGQV